MECVHSLPICFNPYLYQAACIWVCAALYLHCWGLQATKCHRWLAYIRYIYYENDDLMSSWPIYCYWDLKVCNCRHISMLVCSVMLLGRNFSVEIILILANSHFIHSGWMHWHIGGHTGGTTVAQCKRTGIRKMEMVKLVAIALPFSGGQAHSTFPFNQFN